MVCSAEDKVPGQSQKVEVAIIGLGRFGESLALALVERGCRVLGIDSDAVLVQRLSSEIPCAVLDATDEEALQEVNITAFDAVVVAVGTDFESNLMTTVALKNLGVGHIVCRSTKDYEREILLRVGAERVVEPEYDAGQKLAKELTTPGARERLALGRDHAVAKLHITETLAEQSLAQLDLARPEMTVLVIQRGDELLVWPPADTVLLEGDLLVVLGSNEAMASLNNLF